MTKTTKEKTHIAVEYNKNSNRWRIVQHYSDGSFVRLKGAFRTAEEAQSASNGIFWTGVK